MFLVGLSWLVGSRNVDESRIWLTDGTCHASCGLVPASAEALANFRHVDVALTRTKAPGANIRLVGEYGCDVHVRELEQQVVSHFALQDRRVYTRDTQRSIARHAARVESLLVITVDDGEEDAGVFRNALDELVAIREYQLSLGDYIREVAVDRSLSS